MTIGNFHITKNRTKKLDDQLIVDPIEQLLLASNFESPLPTPTSLFENDEFCFNPYDPSLTNSTNNSNSSSIFDYDENFSIFTDNQSIYQFYENNDDCDSLHSHSSISNIVYTNKVKEKLRQKKNMISSDLSITSTSASASNSVSNLSINNNINVSNNASKINKNSSIFPSHNSSNCLRKSFSKSKYSRSRSASLTASINKSNINLSLTPATSMTRSNSITSLSNQITPTLNLTTITTYGDYEEEDEGEEGEEDELDSDVSKFNMTSVEPTPSPNRAINPFYRPPAILKRLNND